MSVPLPDHLDPLPPLHFQPPLLVELAGRYAEHGGALRDLAGRLAAGAEAGWDGEAADAFNRMLRALTGHLANAGDAVGELGAGLRTLAAELELAGRLQGRAERDMRDLDRGQLQPLRRQAGSGADDAEIREAWEQIRARQSTIADDAYRARAYAAGALQRFRRTLAAVVEASYRTLPAPLTGEPGAATDGWLLGRPGQDA
jgi:uncharacterized protein YukE